MVAQTRQWSVELEARIGSVDAPDQALTWVSQVLIGPDGLLYVAQPQDQRIRVFDRAGRLQRTIGRRGRGPGEFERMSAIGFKHDTLYVSDSALRRVNFFSPDGALLRSVEWATAMIGRPPALYFPTAPHVLRADGTALVKPDVPVALLASGTGRVPYFRIDGLGQVLDTLVWQELPPESFEMRSAGNRFFAPKPFLDVRLFHILADGSGVVVVQRAPSGESHAQFHVLKLGVTGDTVFSRVYPYEPIPLANTAVARALDEIAARLSRRPDPPGRREIEQALRQLDLIPERAVPVTAIASAGDGSIWLRRESDGVSPTVWQVLAADGRPVAQSRLPESQRVMAVRDDILATLELDSLDVPYVARYRIRRQ